MARSTWRSFFTRRSSKLGWVVLGGLLALALGVLVDRWGYGEWTFPAWSYFRTNVLEGAAGICGTDPPLSYLWMLPANVFFPALILLLLLAVLAWLRWPRHPLTWTTAPFFVVHNLVSHKEERFLFPMAILATLAGILTLSAAPLSPTSATVMPDGRVVRVVFSGPVLPDTFGAPDWRPGVLAGAVLGIDNGPRLEHLGDVGLPM